MKFLAFDLETGGLLPEHHQIIEVGVALFDGGEVVSTYQAYVHEHPKLDITLRAMRLTGIGTKVLLDQGKDEGTIHRELQAWLHEHGAAHLPVVSHNASFDQSFWSQFVFRQGSWEGKWPNKAFVAADPLFRGPWVCTRRMCAGMFKDQTLDTVAAHFGLSRAGEKHGALEDAILAGKVFAALEGMKVAA